MKKFSVILRNSLLAGLYSFACIQSAFADDTEVFFAPVSENSTKPNIMFAIDTSGSMAWEPGSSNYPARGEQSRMDIVKEVFDDVIVELKDSKVGLMRFNSSAYGGPVLFPVLDLDSPANPVVTREVLDGNDDGVETELGTVNLTSNTLYVDGDNAKYTAIRFQNLGIPQGAIIKSAKIAFQSNGDDSAEAKSLVYAEKVDNAEALSSTDSSISKRAENRTVSAEAWEPESWINGNSYVTSDLSSIVQEIVDRPGWCGGNDLLIFIEESGLGERQTYSADAEASSEDEGIVSPRIRIEFGNELQEGANGCFQDELVVSVNQSGDDAENLGGTGSNALDFYEVWERYFFQLYLTGTNGETALKFRDVKIPKDAEITDAYLEFVSRANRDDSSVATIRVVDSSSPGSAYDISRGSTVFHSDTVGWNIPEWKNNARYNSPSITQLVQNIVNRADWSSGSDIAFRIDATSGDRSAYSYDGNSGNAPKLVINYRTEYQPGNITVRRTLRDAVQGLPADGATPIAGLIAEAAQYFSGDAVSYGVSRWGNRNNRISHDSSYQGGERSTPSNCSEDNPNSRNCASEKILGSPEYISPIDDSCQASHLVYLTDGEANRHHELTRTIYENLSGSTCKSGDNGKDCAVKLAGYMNKNDLSNLSGNQTVNTHMIGFSVGADPELMRNMATAGGGGHYAATDKEQLLESLSQIIASISNVTTTFVTSGVTVNQYNRLTHNDELYYSLFSPQSGSVWPGNVKRYRLSGGDVVDFSGNPAIDPLNGEFSEGARSWWSSEDDGNDVRSGGSAEKLTTERTIYSNISDNSDLTHDDNRFNLDNITESMVDAINESDRRTIINWALGYDVSSSEFDVNDLDSLSDTPAHKNFGDPLHSQPTVLAYNSSSPDKNKSVIFVGTNHGYLHAIDAGQPSDEDVLSSDGEELWAFIPSELLSLLTDIQKETTGEHKYGIDGGISIYLDDSNNNGVVDVDSGEKAYLYVGMRRGGSSYFALDISDPTKPELMFTISPSRSGYDKLGQTWSRPTLGKMEISGVNSDKLVLIFGGGYDTGQDEAATATTTDTVGNRVYIADAITGNKLWDSTKAEQASSPAGPISSMNAIPSDVTAFDLDDDGFLDHIYASDTKAQIFRFDIDNDTGSITGGRIASLQTAADAENNRRFYYSPDVALIRLQRESFLSVSIGSGYRAHPLDDTVTDYFYMIKDKGALSQTFDMHVEMDDLADVTNLVGDTDGNGISDASEVINDTNSPKDGWYIGFSLNGEKIIERSLTFNNAVIFTSYIPPGSSTTSCEAAAGNGRVYAMQIVDGNPYVDTNYDGTLKESDRYVDLISSGIAPQPQIVYTDKARICVGTACSGGLLPDDLIPPLARGLTGIRWRKND